MNEYFFNCTGGFDIQSNLKVGRNYNYTPVCFHLPDGRIVDLFVGLRVTNTDGTEEYLTTDKEFNSVGFFNQAYDELEFYPCDTEVENEDFKEEWQI